MGFVGTFYFITRTMRSVQIWKQNLKVSQISYIRTIIIQIGKNNCHLEIYRFVLSEIVLSFLSPSNQQVVFVLKVLGQMKVYSRNKPPLIDIQNSESEYTNYNLFCLFTEYTGIWCSKLLTVKSAGARVPV